MKALPIYVYRNRMADCTNNGISSRYDELLLICEDGFIEVDENNLPENLVKVVTRKLWDGEYKHIEPVAAVKAGNVGYMYGGNIASSSDSRFRRIAEYPLRIHDRQETQALYDSYAD